VKGIVVIDANLLVLLVVGTASKKYISKHKRLTEYSVEDFEMLGLILADFAEIVLLPHILTEVSNIARQIDNPRARAEVQAALRRLIESCTEFPVQSLHGTQREEFDRLGLTDAVILHVCSTDLDGSGPTLVTVDTALADAANALGYNVIDYKQEFLSP